MRGVNDAAWRAVRSYLRRFGNKTTVPSDVKAGLVLGVESVPDGLAAGLLAGVNPVFGLYGYLIGTIGGALAAGSVLMTVQATGAMAVIISDVPQTQSGDGAGIVLATLAFLTGLTMFGLGLAGAGRLVRFIPTAVLVGFINAVAVSIVLGQLDTVTGYTSSGDNRVARALDTALHLFEFDWLTVLVGLVTIALVLVLERTPLGTLGMVVAVAVGSGAAALLGPGRIALVSDVAEIPNTLPELALPDLSLTLELVVPALSLALVGLVQGAAICSSIPNPDGRYADPSADFRGQGLANLATGLFQGMPVGGSISATALVRSAGGRSALANLVAAIVMALVILVLGQVIGFIAMPALAGLLILVGIRTVKPRDIAMVMRTGPVQLTVLTVTFVLTLIIPLQYAVIVGVGLAIVLHVARQSNRVVVKRWEFGPHAQLPVETDPPRVLAKSEVVVLVTYGSLFFASAPVFSSQLPEARGDCTGTVVILRLRGKDELGSTVIKVLEKYAADLRSAGGMLLLAGVNQRVHRQLRDTKVLGQLRAERVFTESPQLGESLQRALRYASEWQAAQQEGSE
ncbi:SulP family inorganic anion transporter [Leucobacter sp. cx-42]|uniref:SulP family inorganic anion transporter n=1 Tax=unclassified Leucobacter TaxID=2621730 RepID=UPI00165E47CE|nr:MULTISPECIES: SulP family inorganic anion transporter [unclassified Leucobacter]MBC9955394.1 SulP family inorganic anion transporter [Leucobacter sp. cx-42]